MANRILLKETNLSNSSVPPTGYKYLGFDGENLSEKTGTVVRNIESSVSEEGSSEWTTTIINITSAQLVSLYSNPIDLLPAPGINKYYVIDNIILEYKYLNDKYNVDASSLLISGLSMASSKGSFYSIPYVIDIILITGTNNNVCIINDPYSIILTGRLISTISYINAKITLGCDDEIYASGSGTLKVIIRYKTMTIS